MSPTSSKPSQNVSLSPEGCGQSDFHGRKKIQLALDELTIHHVVYTDFLIIPVAIPIGSIHPGDEKHCHEMPVRVDDEYATLLLMTTVACPQPALLDVPRHGLREDRLQPAPPEFWHDQPVPEEERPRLDVSRIIEHHLRVYEEKAV